jgi:hypothetical protein
MKKASNAERCNRSHAGCPRQGVCCECLKHHLSARQLPACCFPDEVERAYDRSFERFADLVRSKSVWINWRSLIS